LPGLGLNFQSGTLPAFHNSAGITYEIRYMRAGETQWRVHATGINAAAPHTFTLPQPGNLHYTAISFYFGNVPANFAQGNEIVLTFVVGANAPNNILRNNFVRSFDNIQHDGRSPYAPTVNPPTTTAPTASNPTNTGTTPPPNVNGGGNGLDLGDGNIPLGGWDNQGGVGQMPQTGIMDYALWLASALFVAISASLGTLSYMKAKKRKHGGKR